MPLTTEDYSLLKRIKEYLDKAKKSVHFSMLLEKLWNNAKMQSLAQKREELEKHLTNPKIPLQERLSTGVDFLLTEKALDESIKDLSRRKQQLEEKTFGLTEIKKMHLDVKGGKEKIAAYLRLINKYLVEASLKLNLNYSSFKSEVLDRYRDLVKVSDQKLITCLQSILGYLKFVDEYVRIINELSKYIDSITRQVENMRVFPTPLKEEEAMNERKILNDLVQYLNLEEKLKKVEKVEKKTFYNSYRFVIAAARTIGGAITKIKSNMMKFEDFMLDIDKTIEVVDTLTRGVENDINLYIRVLQRNSTRDSGYYLQINALSVLIMKDGMIDILSRNIRYLKEVVSKARGKVLREFLVSITHLEVAEKDIDILKLTSIVKDKLLKDENFLKNIIDPNKVDALVNIIFNIFQESVVSVAGEDYKTIIEDKESQIKNIIKKSLQYYWTLVPTEEKLEKEDFKKEKKSEKEVVKSERRLSINLLKVGWKPDIMKYLSDMIEDIISQLANLLFKKVKKN